MITWLNDTLGKHHKFLLGTILAITVASFVLYGFMDRSNTPSGDFRFDARAARPACDLSAVFTCGVDPRTGGFQGQGSSEDFAQVARNSFSREDRASARDQSYQLFAYFSRQLMLADALGIPSPDDKALSAFIRAHRLFKRGAEFSAEAVRNFGDFAHDRLGLDDARVQAAFANLARIEKLSALMVPQKAPALDVLARRLAMKLEAKWTVETAVFEKSSLPAAPMPDDKAVAAFFEQHKADYRVSPKLHLNYVKVSGDTKTVDAGLPSDSELLALANLHHTQFPLLAISPKDEFLKNNRGALMLLHTQEKAGENAAIALSDKLNKLFAPGSDRPETAKITDTLKAAGLTPAALPAYSEDALPKTSGIPDALLKGALSLTANNWRSGVMTDGADAYAFFFTSVDPARDATLAEVRSRVTADVVAAETVSRFKKTAETKAAAIAAAVKSGRTFADAAKAEGLTPAPASDFTEQTAPESLARNLPLLEEIPAGGVSPALPSEDKFVVAHIVARVTQPLAKDDKIVAAILANIGRNMAESTAQNVLDGAK